MFTVNPAGKLSKTTFFEYNSVAGAVDDGWTVTEPDGTQL
jgi:hypothetical protein